MKTKIYNSFLMLLTAVILAVSGGVALAASEDGTYTVFAAGNSSCATFLEDYENGEFLSSIYKNWIAGYITAIGSEKATKKSFDAVTDLNGIMYLVRKSCQETPLEKLAAVVNSVAFDLHEKAGVGSSFSEILNEFQVGLWKEAYENVSEPPLIQAVRKGDSVLVKKWLNKSVYANVVNKDGQPALFDVATQGNAEIVKILIDAGANVNTKDKNGNTALHFAAKKGSVEIIKTLIDAGSDVNAENNSGFTPFDWAELHENDEAMPILKQAGSKK